MTQPPQPPQKPLSEQITDAFVKVLVAGSGISSIVFLFREDMPKALIAGLVATGASLLTTSWESFMKPIRAGQARRMETLGTKADEQLEKILQTPLEAPGQVQRDFLELLKTYCYDLEIEGFRGDLPPLALDDVFVPIRLDSDPSRLLNQDLIKGIWDLLPKSGQAKEDYLYKRLAVVADPGFGKTTLTRHLVLSYANQSYLAHDAKALIPLLLLFRTIHKAIQSEQLPSLPDLVVGQTRELPQGQDLNLQPAKVLAWLNRGECLVMLDGLDEVPEARRELVSRWANRQMQQYPSSVFLLTSRPHGYDSTLFRAVQRVNILEFNRPQKEDFIQRWYGVVIRRQKWDVLWQENQEKPETHRLSKTMLEQRIQDDAQKAADDLIGQLALNPALNALAANPLLITIIAATHRAFDALPNQRVKLYQKIFNLLMEDRPNRRETRLTMPSAEENQAVLQTLAFKLQRQESNQFTREQGSEWIQVRLRECCPDAPLTPKAFLQEIAQLTGLLAGGESNLYQFTHQTFQEYLAALEVQRLGWERWLIQEFRKPALKEVVCFYAALTRATPFVQAALETPEDVETLKLARRMVQEGSRIEPELRDALEQALSQADLGRELNAVVQLEQRFRSLTPLTEETAISDCITWAEYQLFMEAQANKAFHSWAEAFVPEAAYRQEPVNQDVSWEDARWFCAWLATQKGLALEEGVYDYRLPTPEEWAVVRANGSSPPQPWTTDPSLSGQCLRVVRQRIPDLYGNLVGYLANGRWKEADQETATVMLKAAGKQAEDRGYLRLEEIRNFPCEDLRILDHLWVKFSGGRFGFSVQKDLWIEVGGKLDFGEDVESAQKAYEKMSDVNGWRKGDRYLSYSDMTFDTSAPRGHLPSLVVSLLIAISGGGGWRGSGGWRGLAVFSRMAHCKL